ncbi:hypothetical protein HK405_009317, partial [Cladochytrium tenue]
MAAAGSAGPDGPSTSDDVVAAAATDLEADDRGGPAADRAFLAASPAEGISGPGAGATTSLSSTSTTAAAANTEPWRWIERVWAVLNGPAPLRTAAIRPLPFVRVADGFLHSALTSRVPASLRLAALVVYLCAWAAGFAQLAADSAYRPHTSFSDAPEVVSSSSVFVPEYSEGCGVGAVDCLEPADTVFSFRCEAGALSTVLSNVRVVGNQTVAYVPLVVGGGSTDADNVVAANASLTGFPYRGDSFLCAAAIHAGLASDLYGGCATLEFLPSAPPRVGFGAARGGGGLGSVSFDAAFPVAFRFLTDAGVSGCSDLRWAILAFNVCASAGFVALFGGGWAHGPMWFTLKGRSGRSKSRGRSGAAIATSAAAVRPAAVGSNAAKDIPPALAQAPPPPEAGAAVAEADGLAAVVVDGGTPADATGPPRGGGSGGGSVLRREAAAVAELVSGWPLVRRLRRRQRQRGDGKDIAGEEAGGNNDSAEAPASAAGWRYVEPLWPTTPAPASLPSLVRTPEFGARLMFWVLSMFGFWHVSLVADKRAAEPSVADLIGVLLPFLFVLEVTWHSVFAVFLPWYDHMPLERILWILPGFWVGIMYNTEVSGLPLQELTATNIQQEPGALTVVIVAVLVVLVLLAVQLTVAWRSGLLMRYVLGYGSGAAALAALTSITNLQ